MSFTSHRDQLLICYNHTDRGWLDRLKTMLPLERHNDLRLWDDSSIPPGAKWREEIEKALATAKLALLLVSAEFLASEFVLNRELPPLLKAAQREGLQILWVCLSACLYEGTPIGVYQAVLPPAQPLEGMSEVEQRAALQTFAEAIRDAFRAEPEPPFPKPPPPPRLSIPAEDPLPLKIFPTTTSLLRQEAGRWRVERRQLQVEGFREELAEGVALHMVKIPAGTFLMGSPPNEPERWEEEGPQHKVTLGSFLLPPGSDTDHPDPVAGGGRLEEGGARSGA